MEGEAELPDGNAMDLRKRHYNEQEKYIEFIIDEKKYRAYVKKLGYKQTLDIKLESWKQANGSRDVYEMMVRYNLTKARIWKINDAELQKGGEIDELFWNELDEDVFEYLATYLYGKPSLEQSVQDDELLKNLIGELKKEFKALESISSSDNSNSNKEPPSETPQETTENPSNSNGLQTQS